MFVSGWTKVAAVGLGELKAGEQVLTKHAPWTH